MAILDADVSGVCQVAVEAGHGDSGRPWAGAQLEIERGQVVSCVARLEAQPENWVLGPAVAWLDAVIGRDTERLHYGGDGELGREIVHGLHVALFDPSLQPQSESEAVAGEPGA